jgi:hypothetical protein
MTETKAPSRPFNKVNEFIHFNFVVDKKKYVGRTDTASANSLYTDWNNAYVAWSDDKKNIDKLENVQEAEIALKDHIMLGISLGVGEFEVSEVTK